MQHYIVNNLKRNLSRALRKNPEKKVPSEAHILLYWTQERPEPQFVYLLRSPGIGNRFLGSLKGLQIWAQPSHENIILYRTEKNSQKRKLTQMNSVQKSFTS